MNQANAPRVSVVVPVQNRTELLDRALRSVATQDVDLEIIVVDDASDAPVTVSQENVRVLRNPQSLGAQASRLAGVEAATGTYVALLDSDDWWHPDKLRHQLGALQAEPEAVVSCRVVAVRGALRKPAPWRPLARGERVEDFLYVHRGMLQTSTLAAARDTVRDLLRSSADGRVHNDTMLFLEAQRRGLPIVQLGAPLSYFDDNPRPDRVSYDRGRVQASEAWFNDVSAGWSSAARRGFMLTDMVTRYVNTGQRWKAFICILGAYHPKLSLIQYLKKILYIICNGPPSSLLRVGH